MVWRRIFSAHGDAAISHGYSVRPRDGAVCLLHVAKLGESKPKEEWEALLSALVPAEAASSRRGE